MGSTNPPIASSPLLKSICSQPCANHALQCFLMLLYIGSLSGQVKVWDIVDGTLLLTVPDAGDEISVVKCCCDDQVIVVSSKSGISVLSFETGEILHR